jgi:hypothetical protein
MAGSYRLETLAQLGGFSSAVGQELTDLDLALRALAVGWEAVAEPTARVFGEPLAAPNRGFGSGRAAERFFWRHLSSRNKGPAVAGHAIRILGELAIGVVRPRMLLHCLGRLAAVWPGRDNCAELPLHQHPAPSLLGLPIGATAEPGTRRRVA